MTPLRPAALILALLAGTATARALEPEVAAPLPPERPPEHGPPGTAPPQEPSPPMPPERPAGLGEPPAPAPAPGAATDDPACPDLAARPGLVTRPLQPIAEGLCGIPRPLALSKLGGDVAVGDGVILNCGMVLALDTWLQDVVQPAAKETLGTSVAGVALATSYQCRTTNRVPGAKLSEHAFGNGADIASFRLSDKRSLVVGPSAGRPAPEAAFLDTIRAGACRVFTTVLGPGTDPAHGDHLHLDLRARGNGYRICQ